MRNGKVLGWGAPKLFGQFGGGNLSLRPRKNEAPVAESGTAQALVRTEARVQIPSGAPLNYETVFVLYKIFIYRGLCIGVLNGISLGVNACINLFALLFYNKPIPFNSHDKFLSNLEGKRTIIYQVFSKVNGMP